MNGGRPRRQSPARSRPGSRIIDPHDRRRCRPIRLPNQGTWLLALTQATTFVTGTFVVAPGGFGNVSAGTPEKTDPAQPGSINGGGTVVIRLKVGPFTDFTLTGTMDATGRRVTGAINGSGFSGQPFTMDKQ